MRRDWRTQHARTHTFGPPRESTSSAAHCRDGKQLSPLPGPFLPQRTSTTRPWLAICLPAPFCLRPPPNPRPRALSGTSIRVSDSLPGALLNRGPSVSDRIARRRRRVGRGPLRKLYFAGKLCFAGKAESIERYLPILRGKYLCRNQLSAESIKRYLPRRSGGGLRAASDPTRRRRRAGAPCGGGPTRALPGGRQARPSRLGGTGGGGHLPAQ